MKREKIRPEEAMLISLLASSPKDKRQSTFDRLVKDKGKLSNMTPAAYEFIKKEFNIK